MAPSFERIAIVGGTGQLGSDLAAAAKARGLAVAALAHGDADVTQPGSIADAFARSRPTVVVNCAAFHNVDGCEQDPARAFAVNALGALHVARAARAAGARTLFVSTDYVFDGRKPPPLDGNPTPETAYGPDDPPNPINVYGTSKLAGENLTRQADPAALIVRVASLFGSGGSKQKGGNFVDKIIARARAGEELRVVADQWMSPTWTVDASEQILDAIERQQAGTIHATSGGACTWWELATAAMAAARIEKTVQGRERSTSEQGRPRNAALVSRSSPSWRHAVEAYVESKAVS